MILIRPQDKIYQSDKKEYSNLHIYVYPAGKPEATKFLITQCKRGGLGSGPFTRTKEILQMGFNTLFFDSF